MLKVYFPTGNPRGLKILVAAQLAKVPLEHVNITYEDLKKDEHLKRHPLGKVPALETPQGPLFESNAILRYIARENRNAGLYGSTPYSEALVD
jgi:elongation factor 1-gamma